MNNEATEKSIGYNIKKLRQRSGMTQLQLAKEMGVSKQLISAYETGRVTPSHDVLIKLSKTLGTSMNDLFSDKDNSSFIDTTGLDDKQKEIIFELVKEMKKYNESQLLLKQI